MQQPLYHVLAKWFGETKVVWDTARPRDRVDLLGAYGPSNSLGVHGAVAPPFSSSCRGVESAEGGNSAIKRRSSSPICSGLNGSASSSLVPTVVASDFGSHLPLFSLL